MFVCDKCGICCRHIGGIEQLVEYDRGDGVCKYLVDDLCEIYENRPVVCRVDRMYEQVFSAMFTRNEYETLMMSSCRELKKRYCEDQNLEA